MGITPRGLSNLRMTQTAMLLHQGQTSPTDIDLGAYGEWVENQDPLTGEIVRVWEPFPNGPDNPNTPGYDPTLNVIPCTARGIVNGGIGAAGTSESFGTGYNNIDFVSLWVPAYVQINKRDRVTNITDRSGHVVWLDEEYDNPNGDLPPVATVFNVNGVTPLFNPFNRMTDKFVRLERAESYSASAQE